MGGRRIGWAKFHLEAIDLSYPNLREAEGEMSPSEENDQGDAWAGIAGGSGGCGFDSGFDRFDCDRSMLGGFLCGSVERSFFLCNSVSLRIEPFG